MIIAKYYFFTKILLGFQLNEQFLMGNLIYNLRQEVKLKSSKAKSGAEKMTNSEKEIFLSEEKSLLG